MKTLTYNARPQHKLIDGDQIVYGGTEFTVTDKRAEELLADPAVAVTEVPVEVVTASPEDLDRLPRHELNELAAQAGVSTPDGLPNKQAVIEALQAHLKQEAAVTAATQVPREADGEAQTQIEGDSA